MDWAEDVCKNPHSQYGKASDADIHSLVKNCIYFHTLLPAQRALTGASRMMALSPAGTSEKFRVASDLLLSS